MKRIRTSTAILAGLLAFLILLLTGGLLTLRLAPSLPGDDERGFSDFTAYQGRKENLPDTISRVVLDGVWDVEILRSDKASLEILIPEGSDPANFQSQIENTTLRLHSSSEKKQNREDIKTRITLPELTHLSNTGLAHVEIQDFETDSLSILSNGMGDIQGRNNRIENLKIQMPGAGAIDFSSSQVTNADIQLSGAGSISIRMAGGDLSGSLAGLGSIEYSGPVERNSITVSGLGSVSRK